MPSPKFKPGQSGNPSGRPKDQTPGANIRKAIALRSDDILKTVIDAAVLGDMMACKMLLDRITPILKAQAMPICLPAADSLAERGNEIIRAAMAGQIPPDIGSQLISALAAQGKLVELEELTTRIEALENVTAKQSK